MNAREANAARAEGMTKASALELTLRSQYRTSLRATARRVAAKYREKATVVLASADPHGYVRPTLDEVFDGEIAAASATARTQATRRRLVLLAGGPLLVDATLAQGQRDFYAPLVAKQAGKQAERLVAGVRENVASIMLDALTEGWSVDETSATLLEKLTLDADWRATMLARTDLISLGNGAAFQSASALGEAGPQFKVWLTAGDSAVRETHAEAEGQEVAIDEPFLVGDSELQWPGDPDADDSETINCRCVSAFTDAAGSELEHSDEGGISVAASAATLRSDEEDEMSEVETELTAATFTADERKALAKSGAAMPDGGYPIRNASDLSNAIHAIGRGSGSHADIKAHIIKRAKALGLTKSLPEDWNVTASALVADAGDLCDLLDSTLAQAASALDTAFTLAQAIRATYQAEEVAEGDQAMMASADVELTDENSVQIDPMRVRRGMLLDGRTTNDDLLGLGRMVAEIADEAAGEALTAAAAGLAPVAAPSEWFETPEADEPTPLTVTADGRVFGHAATWGVCHTGIAGRCTTAPRSPSGYGYFHLGVIDTEDGQTVPVGRITMDTGHAGLTASRGATSAHYDHTGTQAAFVRASDGEHGIWVSGVLNPDLPEPKVRALKAAALSGDWRNVNGTLELIGLLAVNVPGFPVPRAQAALAASGADDVSLALVAAGIVCDCNEADYEASPVELDALIDASVDERKLRLAVTSAAA